MSKINRSNLRVMQVVSSVDFEASGPSYTVPRLTNGLAGLGCEMLLISLGEPGEKKTNGYCHVHLKQDFARFPIINKLGKSRAMSAKIYSMGRDVDVIHSHGLWMMPNVYPARMCLKEIKPLILSPRGMLGSAALKFSAGKKRIFWILLQRNAMKAVSCFHATSEQEYHDIRAYGLKQPIAVIPNGIDVPSLNEKKDLRSPHVVISLGRIHPKKALDRLIFAWAEVEKEFPNWQLKIVGPSEGGYAQELKALAKHLQTRNVIISAPVFGKQKQLLLQQSELFALPTLNENFGMVVAESLAVGTPVISTKGAPWQGLEENRCGWWIDHGIKPMADALRRSMSLMPNERAVMGARGREWMLRDFSWDVIAEQMVEVYVWLKEGRGMPDCVRLI